MLAYSHIEGRKMMHVQGDPPRKRSRPSVATVFAVVALVTIIMVSLGDSSRRPGTVEGNDIGVYLEGARGFAMTGNPYGTGFVSPAPFAFLLLPLALLPDHLAGWAWFWLSVLALAGVASTAILLSDVPVRGWLVAAAIAALFFWPAVNYGVVLGQNSVLVALLLVVAVATVGTQPAAAGAMVAVALAMKPHLGVVLVVGLAADEMRRRRSPRFVLTCLLTVAALLATTLLYSRRWLEVVLTQPPETWNYWGSTIGPNVFFSVLLGDRSAGWFLYAVILAWVVSGILVWWWRSRPPTPQLGAALLAATLLVTPYAYPHDYVLMALPLIWVSVALGRAQRTVPVLLVVGLWGLVWLAPQPARYDDWRFLALSIPAALLTLVVCLSTDGHTLVHGRPVRGTGLDEPPAIASPH